MFMWFWTIFSLGAPAGFSRRRVITFFRISTSLCLFSFQGQNNVISLMDIHVQHLALLCRICGDEIEDHKRKINNNRFARAALFLKFTNLERFMLLDSPNVHPPLKNNQRNKANLSCKWCISLLIEHALIIWDKIKTFQVLQQAKKAPDAWSQHETIQKNKQEKLINLNNCLFLLWWLVLWFFSC